MMKHGDFTGLAANYAKFRPGYAAQIATAILGYVGRDSALIDAADIGAGTGVWTRMLAARGLHSVVAVEPNDDMRGQGIETSRGTPIVWYKGSAEATGLPEGSADLVTMASSFHWADFDKACDEFHRILRPRGVFVALWNPRLIEANPLLAEIEAQITRLKPDVRRLSSGRSGITERLTEMLSAKSQFAEVLYLEGRHSVRQTPEQYIGVWRSVNDLQVQLGPELFGKFIDWTEKRVSGLPAIETTYLTRAWAARRA
ncbi:MAG TPA: class I SAM-dependent methyltransferase [Candidatus Cybelea sp.]|nr:class I SAM-dependent methyltransferase [Candidatus Cybelea sp.]